MPASPEQGVNLLLSTPALALLSVLALAGAEKAIVATLNGSSRLHNRLRYGPATDPHTWPSWESIGMENPDIERRWQRIEEILHPTTEQQRATDEMIALSTGMLEAWPELAER
jgi:hypothetical protein